MSVRQMDLMDQSKLPAGVSEIQAEDTGVDVERGVLGDLLGVYEYRGVTLRKVRDNGTVRVHVPTYPSVKEYGVGCYLFSRSCVSIGPNTKNRADDVIVQAKNYIDKDYPEGWENKVG
jgi:hypothetical protein